jgi:hypothetical protein
MFTISYTVSKIGTIFARNYMVVSKISKIIIVRFFKFHLKVAVEESIVNAPRITDHGSAVQS